PVYERRRLALVELQAAGDRLFLVVLPLDDLAAADVAGPVDEGWGRDGVVGPAVDAHPSGSQPAEDLVGGDHDVDGQVEVDRVEDGGEPLGLLDGTRAPVQDEP